MGGLLLLLALGVVMALTSFLAGALPLSMSLSQSQLRLISSIGIGILVGTSLIVIIPEGVEAVAMTSLEPHAHQPRNVRLVSKLVATRGNTGATVPVISTGVDKERRSYHEDVFFKLSRDDEELGTFAEDAEKGDGTGSGDVIPPNLEDEVGAHQEGDHGHGHGHNDEAELPTFYIGFSLITGFVLMFLIDRIPKHATEHFNSSPAPRHISLENLSSNLEADEEAGDTTFLGSLAPSPRQSRSLATTTGLVIHAAADGIAMGASATTEDMKLGFIIFVAIMIHKAPAAFGLTSVLLKQGLSKRAARGHLVIFSLAAPVGALGTYMLISLLGGGMVETDSGTWWTGMLLLFSAGTFLYVAMHAMNEEHQHENHSMNGNGYIEANGMSGQGRRSTKPEIRDTLLTVAGMLLPLLTQFGHHH
ncbi:hypothetical protein MKZ38_006159 [Zalerion maritima]|uniref:Uncharacterized protein n=1 Tax=Zalerion maritima TaxID=339359 RepID=A0AAD5RP88_9PEZI|nr:hypothetical protein MKZ38_006159 [Zalerion maritima]